MTKRIQRKRVRGWRLPSNAVCVTRPSVFGNPYLVTPTQSAAEAVGWFRAWVKCRIACSAELAIQRRRLLARLPELVGKDLACFCREDAEHCHADVLLEMARGLAGKGRAA